MTDRVSRYPGRVKITPVSGQANIYDMEMADEPTIAGTYLNKANLLTDSTAQALGIGGGDPTVNDALKAASKGLTKQTTVMLSTGWSGEGVYSQDIAVPGGSETSKVDLQPTAVQISQLISAGVSALTVLNSSGTFTAFAVGGKPAYQMDMQATVTEIA